MALKPSPPQSRWCTQGVRRHRLRQSCLVCTKVALTDSQQSPSHDFCLKAFTRPPARCVWDFCPHLFRLTIEAFCPALLKTSFHSSSFPRIMYLQKEGKCQNLLERRGLFKENRSMTTLSAPAVKARTSLLRFEEQRKEHGPAAGLTLQLRSTEGSQQQGWQGLPAGASEKGQSYMGGSLLAFHETLSLTAQSSHGPLPSHSLFLPAGLCPELCLSPLCPDPPVLTHQGIDTAKARTEAALDTLTWES